MHLRTKLLSAPLIAAALLPGCAAYQLSLSEAETAEILDDISARVLAEREVARKSTLDRPREKREQPVVPKVLTLEQALVIAHGFNRELATDRESMILSALALRGAQNDVGPRLEGSVSSVLRGGDDRERTRSNGGVLSLLGILPTGADVSLTGATSRSYGESGAADGDPTRIDGSVVASIRQPLLRGFGEESAYESLTDAERQALYDVRAFELARQDLALQVQRDFYGIVAQKQVVVNREVSLEGFAFLKRRSETLFEVDRVSELDVFRARREYLTAENSLVDARQLLAARIDRFKVLLGIDDSVSLEVSDEIPEVLDPGDVDLMFYIEVALRNRLELMTGRGVVADAERKVRLRSQDLLPQLDLVATHTRMDDGKQRHYSSLDIDDDNYLLSVELELPLDRVAERNALRRARIAQARARRALSELEDSVILEVRDAARNYRSALSSVAIQEQIAFSEEKNAKVAALRFENGEISNRDLTDANNNLVDARDRLVRERVDLEVQKAEFLRAVGLLWIKEDGTWTFQL